MKKIIGIILLTIIIVAGIGIYTDFNIFKSEEIATNKEKIARNLPAQEVEIFDLKNDESTLKLTKSGIGSADSIVYVTPQIAGKITNIQAKVGDKVKKGETLITLGESLSTGIIDEQYQNAVKSRNLTQKILENTQNAAQNNLQTAKISVDTALLAYQNAVATRDSNEELLELQIQNAEIATNSAKNAYKTMEDQYENAKDDFDDAKDKLKDQIDDLKAQNAPQSQINALKDQLDDLEEANEDALEDLESAKKTAKNTYEQAKLSIEQAEKNYQLQTTQLNLGLQSSYNQYLIAVEQFEAAGAAANLQELQVEGQVIQSETNTTISGLNKAEKNIKAEVDGTVTSITAKEGNQVAPGQIVMKIEQIDKISIKTTLNEKEAAFVKVGDKVKISTDDDDEPLDGEITSISPTLNEVTKKIDIEIDLTDSNKITSGAFVKITFLIKTNDKKVFVPLNGIFIENNQKYVWTVIPSKEGTSKTKKQEVQTGEIIDNFIEIKSGLKGTEKIVKTSRTFLEEGESVIIK